MNNIQSPFGKSASDGAMWIAGGSNRPVPLDDPRCVWAVRRGYFDVFAAMVKGPGGRRHHLFRAQVGTLLFGTKTTDNGYGLLAVGSIESAIERSRVDAAADTSGVENWITHLSRAAADPPLDWPDRIAVPGRITLQDGQRLTADPHQLYWVEVASGAIRFLGRDVVGPGGRIPLAAQSWIVAEGEVAVMVIGRGLVDIRDLSVFNRVALDAMSDRIQHAVKEELHASAASRGANRQNLDTALRDLAGAARTGRGRAQRAAAVEPLVIALGTLFEALQIDQPGLSAALAAVAAGANSATANERLHAITDQLRLGRRRVVLQPEWWQSEGPAMLGWRGKDRTPVALVCRPFLGWEMTDGEGARPMDAAEAGRLALDAVQLYATLPTRPLSFRNLFAFGGVSVFPDLVRGILAALTVGLLAVSVPFGSHLLVDTVIPDGDVPNLVIVIAALVAASLGSGVFEVVKSTAILRAESRFESRLQPGLFQRLIALPTKFFRAHTAGDIADRVLGVQAAREILSGSVVGASLSGIFGMVSLIPLFFYQGEVAWIGVGLALLIALVIAALSYGQLRHERERLRHQGRLDGFVLQILQGFAKLRVAAAEPRAMAQWVRYFVAQRDRFVSAQWWIAGQTTIMAFLPTLATAIVYAALAYALKGDLTKSATDHTAPPPFSAADFVAFSSAFGQVMTGLAGVAKSLTQMLTAVPLIERAKPLLGTPIDVRDQAGQPGSLSGGIELKHVKFRYSADGPLVLDDVSFRIEPGQFIAIVGASGSGKSTIMRLLLGFERSEIGDIFYDGKSVEHLDMAAVRRQIGVVLQHGRISSGSIYDNIVVGAGVGFDAAWSIARLVGLDSDIEDMPMGMHTVLLDGGATLSGGQRQRILIARALVRQPRILLLDEATSALDNRTQAVVTETLGKLSITRIVIAHRLSTIQSVDRVVVMDRGRLVETGTYDELAAAAGPFAALAKRQLL